MTKKSKLIIRLCLAVCCLSALPACKKEQPPQPAQAPVQPPAVADKPKPVLKAVSSAQLPSPPVNQFDFSNKKDPFKPYVIAKPAQNAAGNRQAPRDALPIHSFDVSKFRLIGVIAGGKENQAMVVDPNGKGYVLKVGMTIGNSNGRITAISAGGVDVVEQFTDDNGRVRKENIKITLPRKQ